MRMCMPLTPIPQSHLPHARGIYHGGTPWWLTPRLRYQMYLDNMPTWALVGDFGEGHTDHEQQGDDTYIWTHKKIDVGYNGNQIVDVNSTTARRVLLKPGITIHFT